MTIPIKKLTNGFAIPVYGLGTWEIGGRETHDPTNNDESDIATIRTAIDLGVTHIDTAEIYANGYTEILIGKAIAKYERKKLFLASKVGENHLRYDDVIKAAKNSLHRLQTTYLDLYLAHRYNPTIPVKETIKAMETLVEEGIIKYIGVSNYTNAEFEEAQSYTKYKIVVNQLHYNIQYREVEKKGIVAYCQKHDSILVAYRPLQKGMFADEIVPIIHELAKKYDKTPAQIAINWLIAQKNIVTIAKTSSIQHLKENLAALNWSMDEDDIERVRKEFPNQQTVSDVVPLH